MEKQSICFFKLYYQFSIIAVGERNIMTENLIFISLLKAVCAQSLSIFLLLRMFLLFHDG